MTTARETLTDWLRDAHAMEAQAVEMLERQRDRIRSYPDILAKVEEHLDLSRLQGERVEQCLHLLDAESSSLKAGIGKLVANAQSLTGLVTSDEIVKACVFSAAFERFEIGNYTVLIAAAEELGELEVARLLGLNREEEMEMADWIEQRLPDLTRTYLARAETEPAGDAKR